MRTQLTVDDLDRLPGDTIIRGDYTVARKSRAGEWWATDHVGPIDPLKLLLSDVDWRIVYWGVG